MNQALCYNLTGFYFKFAFGPEQLPRLSRNGTLNSKSFGLTFSRNKLLGKILGSKFRRENFWQVRIRTHHFIGQTTDKLRLLVRILSLFRLTLLKPLLSRACCVVYNISVKFRLNNFNYLESIYGSNVHLQRKYFRETYNRETILFIIQNEKN